MNSPDRPFVPIQPETLLDAPGQDQTGVSPTSVYPRPMVRDPTPMLSSTPVSLTSDRSECLQPYLSLPARLSHTILSLPLLSLGLALVSFITANNTAQSRAADAKAQIMATCKGVEQGVRFITDGHLALIMAQKVNEQTVDAIQATMRGLHKVLEMSLTIIEKVIGFMIDLYRSLLMCTIELVVRGTLELLISAVEGITEGITLALSSLRTEIQQDIQTANNAIASAVKTINTVTSLVNVNLNVPQFDIPSLDGLANIQIPTTFQDQLRNLNSTLPTLEELRDSLDQVLAIPFKKLKEEMNGTFGELEKNITVSALPTPQIDSASASKSAVDLCASMDTSFLDDITQSLAKLAKIATGLLILAFFLLWIALIVWEWWIWKLMKEQAESVEELVAEDVKHGKIVDGMRMVQMVEHPVVEKYGGYLVRRVTRKNSTDNNLRWFVAYITHPPALLLLGFGALTFLTMQIQLSAVHALRERSTAEAEVAISDHSRSLGVAINEAMLGHSEAYANDMNAVIRGWQDTIDSTVFGPWLNTTTVALNTTLVDFYDRVEQVLDLTFGKTVLSKPVNSFVYCILGSKIDNMETALTWIKDNARVTLPTIDSSILMLSNSTMDDVSTPIAAAAAGDASSGDGQQAPGVIAKLFDKYEDALRKQRDIAAIFLGLYGAILLIGLCVFVWKTWLERKLAGWRTQRSGQDWHNEDKTASLYPTDKGGIGNDHLSTKPPYETQQPFYGGGNVNPSQLSFFDDSDDVPRKEGMNLQTGNKLTTMAQRLRTFSPIRHSFKEIQDYQEPVVPPHPPCPPLQNSSWQTKLGSYLAAPLLPLSSLGRKPSQKSEKSWAGASTSPAADVALGSPAELNEKSGRMFTAAPSATNHFKPAGPSPLTRNPFIVGDVDDPSDDLATPIAAQFTRQDVWQSNHEARQY